MSVKYLFLLVVYLYVSSSIKYYHHHHGHHHHHHHHHSNCLNYKHYNHRHHTHQSCSRLYHISVSSRMTSFSYSRSDVLRTESYSMSKSMSMSVLEPSSMMDSISSVIEHLPSISKVIIYDSPSSPSSSFSSLVSIVDNSIILSSSSSAPVAVAINVDIGTMQ